MDEHHSDEQLNERLYEVLSKVDNAEDMKKLLDDLCTYTEVEQMAQRIEAATLLMNGLTYEQVTQRTGASSATLSRVSRCIRHGSGGYAQVLKGVSQTDE